MKRKLENVFKSVRAIMADFCPSLQCAIFLDRVKWGGTLLYCIRNDTNEVLHLGKLKHCVAMFNKLCPVRVNGKVETYEEAQD